MILHVAANYLRITYEQACVCVCVYTEKCKADKTNFIL